MILPTLALRLAPYAAAAALGAVSWHYLPFVGAGAQIGRAHDRAVAWEKAADAWRSSSRGWEASFRLSDARRATETATARSAVNDLNKQCSIRVREARASAKAIREIAYAPVKLDAAGCPARGGVGVDRLRNALQPASATGR